MIYKKIAEIQEELGTMKKSKKGYNYMYFDINQLLEQLPPLLKKHNLTLTQPLTILGERATITTVLTDNDEMEDSVDQSVKAGKMVQFTTPLPDVQDPQKMGSAITYMRRYALQSLFALEAEDDDAESASKGRIKKEEVQF